MGLGNTLMHATLTATVWIPLSVSFPGPAGRNVDIAGPSADVLPKAEGECQGVVQEQPDLELQKTILFLVTLRPGMDDEEIARSVGGISAFEASVALRDMERAGLVLGR